MAKTRTLLNLLLKLAIINKIQYLIKRTQDNRSTLNFESAIEESS